MSTLIYKARCEKTGLRGFRPGPSQTRLYNHTRGLKYCIYEEEGLHYPSSENKGADQLRGYREADLRLCFRKCKSRFSRDEDQLDSIQWMLSKPVTQRTQPWLP